MIGEADVEVNRCKCHFHMAMFRICSEWVRAKNKGSRLLRRKPLFYRVPEAGLETLIKLLEKNAISEIGEADSEAISKFLTDLLDLTRT